MGGKRKGTKGRAAKASGATREAKEWLRGRFQRGIHPALDRVNRSFEIDRRMAAEDVRASIVHACMLGERGILPA
ncbi:MAG: argininosuccinate lyase, partial [Planctomycetota bacterium]